MPTNLDLAREVDLLPIHEVAASAGLSPDDFEPLGRFKAKLTWEGMARLKAEEPGRLALVTAVTPTPAGEGKTTTSVGLAQGLRRIGRTAVPALREPALGPLFGVKGGATGGGRSQVLPSEDINLFFTGDFPAIAAAHNLLSAMIDAHIANGNELDIDVRRILWPRTVDMNDRALREVTVGLGGRANGFPREDGYVITPASEVMAVFCLASSLADLQARLAGISAAETRTGRLITAGDLGAAGAMAALLSSALRPNLVQTSEGGPALIHGGPFANIAHGCSSILAAQAGLGMAEWTVTEAGFGADLGAHKFLTIKAPLLGRRPDVIVLVATLRALKHLGEGSLEAGSGNLRSHLERMKAHGLPVVVALNRFEGDRAEEAAQALAWAREWGAVAAVEADPWMGGGEGCRALAEAVDASSAPDGAPCQADGGGLRDRLNQTCRTSCGASGAELDSGAEADLRRLERLGLDGLPICLAKTPASLTDDPDIRMPREPYVIHIRRLRASTGAGFIVAEAGEIMLMPGLGKRPRALDIFVDEDGRIQGLN